MPRHPSPERVPMQRIGGVVASRLTKRFGDFTAVDAIDFVVEPVDEDLTVFENLVMIGVLSRLPSVGRGHAPKSSSSASVWKWHPTRDGHKP